MKPAAETYPELHPTYIINRDTRNNDLKKKLASSFDIGNIAAHRYSNINVTLALWSRHVIVLVIIITKGVLVVSQSLDLGWDILRLSTETGICQ